MTEYTIIPMDTVIYRVGNVDFKHLADAENYVASRRKAEAKKAGAKKKSEYLAWMNDSLREDNLSWHREDCYDWTVEHFPEIAEKLGYRVEKV